LKRQTIKSKRQEKEIKPKNN